MELSRLVFLEDINGIWSGLEKSGRKGAFGYLRLEFCDQKYWASRSLRVKNLSSGAAMRPNETSLRLKPERNF